MKRIILCLMVLTNLFVSACSAGRDAEVTAFINDSDKLTKDILAKVKANPTATGIEEAQKILNAKKPDLKAKYNELKSVRGFQVKEETMKKFTDSVFTNMESVNSLKIDFAEKSFDDKVFGDKIDKLVADYNALFES